MKDLRIEDGEGTLSLGYHTYNSSGTGKGLFYDCPLETLYLGRDLSYDTTKYYGYSPFYGKSTLKSVTIGNSVTSIGGAAFYGCSGLTSVVIPNSVTSIGGAAFYGCSGLTAVHISDLSAWCNIDFSDRDANPLYYVKNLYLNGELVTDLVIPDGVAKIKDYAFWYCSGLTSVVIGNGVTSFGYKVFEGCTGLTSVTIGNSVTSIGNDAFYDCYGLKTVINYSSLTITKGLSNNGYVGYYAEKVINAPNGTIEGDFVFVVIDGVNTLVEYLGNDTEIVLPDNYSKGNYAIGEAFRDNTSITSIEIPNSVTSIGDYAFSGCAGLTDITIPNSVTTIGTYAFYDCNNIESLYIGNSIQQIGDYAFNGCDNLFDIKVANKKVIEISYNVFSNDSYNNAILYVPEGRSAFYKNTTPWRNFIVIEEIDFDKIEITGISLDKSTATITEGETVALVATITPSTATDKTVTWTTSNSAVATVSNGVVTALSAGTATITATAGNYDASCVVTVKKKVVAVTGITLDKKTLSIIEGERTTLVATVAPSTATDKTVTWTTSNSAVATVSNGVVTALSAGTATITATAGNYSATCVVTVEKKVIAVTGISLDKSTATITEGETVALTATITPSTATDKTVTWTTSNSAVATVSNGVVTALSAGRATITATAGNHSATCVVTVEAKEEPEETAGLRAGINYRIKHNTTGYYMTVVSTESSNQNEGGVQIKALDKEKLGQAFTLERVAENSYKIKSINGYYLSSFASWGYNATVNNSDAAIHQFTEIEEGIYTLSGYLGYIGSNSDDGGGKEEGAWIYSNHDSNAQNIYWVFEPLTAEDNKELVSLQTTEAMNALERSIVWGKEMVSSRAAALSNEDKTSINTAVQTAENEKGNACGDVDEEIARLTALAKTIDTAVENAIYVWNIDDISNSVCYTVSTEDRGSWYSEELHLNSTQKLDIANDIADTNQQFAFVKSANSGKYYLYSVGEEKFVAINGSYTTLTETPEMGIVFLNGTRSAAYPWVVAFDTEVGGIQISVSNGYDPGVITSWNSLNDSGNTVRFEKAAAFDATAALSLIKGYESGVTGISLDKETITITEGETETLVATVTPADATDKTVTWTTSNSAVVTVSNGVVTALSAGTATVTATAGNYSATCVVTVEKKVIAVTGISLDNETLSIIVGETKMLVATITPADATDKTVTWTTSNSGVATVSNGVVTALSAGTATITATVGSHSASCVVTVKAGLAPGINYRIKHNTTGYYMTVVSTESSNHDAGGVQIKALDKKELDQVFILESVAENSYKIKSINGYYLSSFGSWGYNATVNDSDAAIHQFTEVEENIYTLSGYLGYIGSNNNDRNGNVDGAWIYSNHGSTAQNIYWVFEPLTAEDNKELAFLLQTAEAMNALERSIARGKDIVSSRAAVLSNEDKTSINTVVQTAENEKGNACGDVDKEIARLTALAKAIDTAVENAIYVWNIDDISNSVCYTVSTEDRGSWYSEELHLNSTQKLDIANDIADTNQQFAFVKSAKSDKYYLYSVGEEKFVAINGSHTTLTETPEMGIVFLNGTRSAAYPWVVALDTEAGEKQISVSNSYDPGVITFWNDLNDSGNTVRFEKAAAFDATAALSLIEGYESETTGIEQMDGVVKTVYDLNGRRIVDTEYLEHGVYIINGKKVVY